MRSRLRFLVKGEVQGIGYRFFVLERAETLGLTGWVRNLPGGDVEGEAEGDPAALETLLKDLRSGHRWARVSGVSTEQLQPRQGEAEFRIVH